MNKILKSKISEALSSVLPITGIVLLLSIFLVPLELGAVVMFFFGAMLLIVGMGMFQLGAEMAMTPLGEGIGVGISKSKKALIVPLISFIMGIMITVAEPDLQVLSTQVPGIPNAVLIFTIAVGVGLFLMVAVLRILFKVTLSGLLIFLYALLLLLSLCIPENFLAVAFDSGGVTTGPMTVPFIMAMGVGISLVRGDKDAASDSFGLVALCSVGPILAVMLLGLFFTPEASSYAAMEILHVYTMRDVFHAFAKEIPHYAKEVTFSLAPLIVMFFIFQFFSHRWHRRQKLRIMIGFVYTYMGLVLFLCGVGVGFAPVGTLLGRELASHFHWSLVFIGMLIGYFIVKAEPAIQILNHQVHAVTDGIISSKAMRRALSIGVSVSVGIAMLRIITGIPISYIVIPGYVIALLMSLFVPKIFVGIAFDSGGVASGPMTSTFLLPICIGACESLGGNIITDAFGVIALVALTPLIAIQSMGIAYRLKLKRIDTQTNRIPDDSDIIIEFEED